MFIFVDFKAISFPYAKVSGMAQYIRKSSSYMRCLEQGSRSYRYSQHTHLFHPELIRYAGRRQELRSSSKQLDNLLITSGGRSWVITCPVGQVIMNMTLPAIMLHMPSRIKRLSLMLVEIGTIPPNLRNIDMPSLL